MIASPSVRFKRRKGYGITVPQYQVENMRVLLPSAKVAAKNPDRVFSITGSKITRIEDGEVLSVKSKVILREMVQSPEWEIDVEKGTFTLPDGQRGRRASEGASLDAINAAIAAALADEDEDEDTESDEEEDTESGESDTESDEESETN